MDVLPIPPVPIRATGARRSAKSTILSINSSRPKNMLGGRGGDSPGVLDMNEYEMPSLLVVEIADLS